MPFPDVHAAAEFLGSTPVARSWAGDLEERADGMWPRFEPEVMRAAIAAVVNTARWAEWQQVTAPTKPAVHYWVAESVDWSMT